MELLVVTIGGRILGKGPMRTAHLRTVRMGLEDRLLSTCFVSFGPIQHSIALVVMETKVSTLVIWLFWTVIEGIRLNIKILS